MKAKRSLLLALLAVRNVEPGTPNTLSFSKPFTSVPLEVLRFRALAYLALGLKASVRFLV